MNTGIEEISEQEATDAGLIPDLTQGNPNEEQAEIETAFIESDCHHWQGVRLEPFSSRRQTAANCLGLRFGSLSKDEIAHLLESFSYPEMMLDSIIVVYLCYPRGKKKENGMTESIEESYAACDPGLRKQVRRRMLEWGEAQGIDIGSAHLAEAFSIMTKIVKETIVPQFKLPKAEGRAPRGN